jgi:hypothetical protein
MTTMAVEINTNSNAQASEKAVPDRDADRNANPDRGGMPARILIADDQPDVLESLRALLK